MKQGTFFFFSGWIVSVLHSVGISAGYLSVLDKFCRVKVLEMYGMLHECVLRIPTLNCLVLYCLFF